MGPRPFVLLSHRHHVLVGHQKDGSEGRRATRPGVEEAEPHGFSSQRGVDPGVGLGDPPMEGPERM